MAIKDKAALKADNNNIIKPGVIGGIAATDDNAVREDNIDSNLNLAELTLQKVLGAIEMGVIEVDPISGFLHLKVDSGSEHVIQGRHTDLTGLPSLSNTTAAITANNTNLLAMVTLGNNSQGIEFVKQGVFRGKINNNRDRNSIGLENASGDYIEMRPDGEVYHNNRSISSVKAYAEDTAANTDRTTLSGSDTYARCELGSNFVERIGHGFSLSGSRFENTGPAFKGIVTFSVDIANSANVDILYDLRISINNTTNLVGIWRHVFVFPGKPSHALVDAYVELATNDFVQLNIKQPNGALFHPTLRRNTLKIE